jgi:hypothetical protein
MGHELTRISQPAKHASGSGALIRALILTVMAAAPIHARRQSFGAHDILLTLKTPQDMVFPTFPSHYRVPVTLSGDIASEIAATISDMKLPVPRFEELMPSKGACYLRIANEDYDADTRELLAGILNPVQIIDIAVNSILRFRDKEYFPTLVKETNIAVSGLNREGRGQIAIELTPRGDRFGYQYEDLGVYVQESWLTKITLLADSSTRLVTELTQYKVNRQFTVAQENKPAPDTIVSHYRFEYVSSGDSPLPAKLTLDMNGKPALVIAASYRQENNRTVFDDRSVCCLKEGDQQQCLTMHYGEYRFEGVPQEAASLSKPKVSSRELAAAAKLARDATYQLRAGMIYASKRTLRKLADDYPNTPQAVEAKKLLANLPNAF